MNSKKPLHRAAHRSPLTRQFPKNIVDFFAALCLVLVIEGLLPFVAPNMWRDTMQRAANLTDGQLRTVGLLAIVVGLVSYWLTVTIAG